MKSSYSIQQRYDLIMDCRSSGLSDYRWCKEHGISPSTFYGWINQVKEQCIEIPEPSGRDTYNLIPQQDVVKLDIFNEKDDRPACLVTNEQTNLHSVEIALGKSIIKISNDVKPELLKQIISCLGGCL